MDKYTNKKKSKQQIAYEAIKDAIINYRLKSGEILVERQLCAKLGISRTPVREALRILANEGLVEFIPNKGAFVSHIRVEDIIEIYDIRANLEGLAVRLYISSIPDSIIDELRSLIAIQEDALSRGQVEEFIKSDIKFHRLYVENSSNKRLKSMLQTISDQITRFAMTTLKETGNVLEDHYKQSLKQHYEILDAITVRDGEKAEQAIKKHIECIKEFNINRLLMGII